MPRKKHKNKKTTLPIDALPDNARQHLSALGMSRVEDYFDWCRAQGFACGYRKTKIQCENEQAHATRLRSNACVRDARSARRPTKLLRRLLAGDSCDRLPPSLKALSARLHGPSTSNAQRGFAIQVLDHVSKRCPDLLFERTGSGPSAGMYIEAVLKMIGYHRHTVRPIQSWRPRTHNARRRVASLARHLFAKWDVPLFLDSVWFDDPVEGVANRAQARVVAAIHRDWFLHIGAGKNIRTAKLPLRYSKKMAHHFLRAPEDYTVVEALRWGQVYGLGGDGRLVEALRGTQVMRVNHAVSAGDSGASSDRDAEPEGFWSSVIQFFVRQPMLDAAHCGPIIDYLHNQRFVGEDVIGDDGRLRTIPPPQPGLSMRGRTAETLLQQVDAWHRRLGMSGKDGSHVAWSGCGLPGFRSVEGNKNQRIWTIRELTNKDQLHSEGRHMKHCVATYLGSCRSGRSSIWAMEVESKDGISKILTIEVLNAGRRIVQAKGPSNRRPSPQARAVMARWAAAAELSIAAWV